MQKNFLLFIFILFFAGCQKEKVNEIYLDDNRSIKITDKLSIDNGIILHNHIFNYVTYDNFLKYLSESDRFLIVQQKDLEKTTSTDKVILSLRHDVDDNIKSAVKFAYLENKYGIKSTYFILHTAPYYGVTIFSYFKRNDDVLYFIRKIQEFGHDIGWHNDLVTLQIMYGLDPKDFLKTELGWLRENGISIAGTTSHGSHYCDVYHYLNSYFWKEVIGRHDGNFYNTDSITKGYTTFQIEKDSLKNYNFEYEGLLIHSDYFFADSDWPHGKRWNMGMVNLDTIKPGKKVIILLHPQHWD